MSSAPVRRRCPHLLIWTTVAFLFVSWPGSGGTARAGALDDPPGRGDDPPWVLGDWHRQDTEPFRGKQDDIVFVTRDIGWYGNGSGRVYGTTDGGTTWTKLWEQPGTFVRCLAFLDEHRGFLGNVGTDYFPGVTDGTPLYRTEDGGHTWAAVAGIVAPGLKGLCALQVLRYPFINAGVPGEKTLLVAGGRVGGPAWLLLSSDLGATWRPIDLSAQAGMILDAHFFTDRIGLVAAASSSDVSESHARILRTEDGGATWEVAWESPRPFELTWKLDFPTRNVGYCTVQSYDPDPAASQRFVAKTTDGGRTWSELPLVDDAAVREFGVGFLDAQVGFVGAMPHGFATTDGGASWSAVEIGNAVNKVRVIRTDEDGDGRDDRARVFAIGVEVHRLDAVRADRARPRKFEARIGGMGSGYSVTLEGEALVYRAWTAARAEEPVRITPSVDDWQQFRDSLDRLGAWHWQAKSDNAEIRDGTDWSLDLVWGPKSVASAGLNAYPGGALPAPISPVRDPATAPPPPGGEPTAEFEAYLAAVSALVGGREFR